MPATPSRESMFRLALWAAAGIALLLALFRSREIES